MKETGVIFSTPMVQALQRGKTVTRRTRGLEEINKEPDEWKYEGRNGEYYIFIDIAGTKWLSIKCPYGGKGDLLRVKEKYCHKVDPITAIVSEDEFWYFASDPEVYKADGDGGMELTKSGYLASPWKSPIFMPKAASRYYLPLIADPIPERVQSIRYDDILDEGWDARTSLPFSNRTAGEDARDWYIALWDFLNAKRGYSWARNPWCWPLRFKPLTGAVG
jgi:hypothetical protein